jgi:hypothetical protein
MRSGKLLATCIGGVPQCDETLLRFTSLQDLAQILNRSDISGIADSWLTHPGENTTTKGDPNPERSRYQGIDE